MQTRTTETSPHDAAPTAARNSRLRAIAFWAATLAVGYELTAGSVWNLIPIEWVEVQLHHLGYPRHLAYLLGVWQVGAAVVILAPRLALAKEWAYAGSFFLWSGAVVAHLVAGDDLQAWGVPLAFTIAAVASWALRPADRRLPETRLPRRRPAGAGPEWTVSLETRTRTWETRPRAWAVPIGLLVALYAFSFLTLPAMEDVTHQWAVENGWIDR